MLVSQLNSKTAAAAAHAHGPSRPGLPLWPASGGRSPRRSTWRLHGAASLLSPAGIRAARRFSQRSPPSLCYAPHNRNQCVSKQPGLKSQIGDPVSCPRGPRLARVARLVYPIEGGSCPEERNCVFRLSVFCRTGYVEGIETVLRSNCESHGWNLSHPGNKDRCSQRWGYVCGWEHYRRMHCLQDPWDAGTPATSNSLARRLIRTSSSKLISAFASKSSGTMPPEPSSQALCSAVLSRESLASTAAPALSRAAHAAGWPRIAAAARGVRLSTCVPSGMFESLQSQVSPPSGSPAITAGPIPRERAHITKFYAEPPFQKRFDKGHVTVHRSKMQRRVLGGDTLRYCLVEWT